MTAKWRSVFRDVAIIVAGVLCALAGQAWWANRQDHAREQDDVRQLLSDTRRTSSAWTVR